MPNNRMLTISAFVKELQVTHPALSASKVRYLERQGLLQPKRTQGGYRLFSEQDLERALNILKMQDEYLPLKVIKARLQKPTPKDRSAHKQRSFDAYGDNKLHLIEHAQATLNVPVSFIQELAKCGFIKLLPNAQKKMQVAGEDYPQILRCYALYKAGIGPRNMRFLAIGAGHQIALLEQVLAAQRFESPNEQMNYLAHLMEDVQKHMVLSTFTSRNKE